MIHELYAILAFVCAVIIGLLELRTVTVKYSTVHKKSFTVLFSVSIVFCIIDTMWGVFSSQKLFQSKTLIVIFSYLFHLSASFTTFYWYCFNLRFLNNKYSKNKLLHIFSTLFFVLCIGIVFSNIVNHSVFYVDDNLMYHTEALRTVLFFIQYSIYFVMLITCIVSRISEKSEEKKALTVISIIYSVFFLVAGFLQFLYADLPSYSLGFMFSCLIIYIFVITTENEKLMLAQQKAESAFEYQKILQRNNTIISSLAGNYDCVVLVDTTNNTIQIINASGIFADFIKGDTIEPAEFDKMLNTVIPKKSIKKFIKNVDREKLMKPLLAGERVSVETDTNYKGKKDHYRLNIAIDKDDSEHVLFGFKNMESEYVMRQEIENQKNYITNLEVQNQLAVMMASIDGLTGLLNKISFIEKVERYITDNTSVGCALLFFDMDHFKSINDIFGHEKGDEALREMSLKLKSMFRADELISRMGGDEFCIFLPHISLEIVQDRIDLMNEKLQAVYSDENATIKTSASIGCVYCKEKNLSYVEMHTIADAAMYEVKERGRDGHEIKVV